MGANIKLKAGTVLEGRYRIDGSHSSDRTSFTYKATHLAFNKQVLVKEFFMEKINRRDKNGTQVLVNKSSDKELFKKKKEAFRMEANALSKNHKNGRSGLIDYFEANNTSYYVMDYAEGNEYVDDEVIEVLPSSSGNPSPQPDAATRLTPSADDATQLSGHPGADQPYAPYPPYGPPTPYGPAPYGPAPYGPAPEPPKNNNKKLIAFCLSLLVALLLIFLIYLIVDHNKNAELERQRAINDSIRIKASEDSINRAIEEAKQAAAQAELERQQAEAARLAAERQAAEAARLRSATGVYTGTIYGVRARLSLNQNGTSLSGSYNGNGRQYSVWGSVDGGLNFDIYIGTDYETDSHVTGTITGRKMSGWWEEYLTGNYYSFSLTR